MHAVTPAITLAPGIGVAAIPAQIRVAPAIVPQPMFVLISCVIFPEIVPIDKDIPSFKLISEL